MSKQQAFRPVVVIPVYNHEQAIPLIVEQVIQFSMPIVLVDDGSHQQCQQVLQDIAAQRSTVSLIRLDQNGGKGAAVKAGLCWALKQGFSHALQIDADGQHDADDIVLFIDTAKQHVHSLVTGYPEYDASVPKLRYYARYLTHIWIWINSVSFKIKDSMCGFRVYPLQEVVPLLERCGNRMDFDPEIMVRWTWQGGDVINCPTKVHYPIDGVSHFLPWTDNGLISAMHTRLFFGMLVRLPRLLWQKING